MTFSCVFIVNFEHILRLLIKPGIQEWGTECEECRECSERFRGIFKKILVNLNFDLFLEILLVFHQILLLNYYETMKQQLLSNSSTKNIFFTTPYNWSSEFNYCFFLLNYFLLFLFTFSFLSF